MKTKKRFRNYDNKTLWCIYFGLRLMIHDKRREKSREFWKELYQEAEAELDKRSEKEAAAYYKDK